MNLAFVMEHETLQDPIGLVIVPFPNILRLALQVALWHRPHAGIGQ